MQLLKREHVDAPPSDEAAAREAQTARVFRQQVVGFAVAGLVVLAYSLHRAGWHNVFTTGWWRW